MPRGGPVFRHEVVKAPAGSSLTAAAKRYESGPGAESLRKTGRRTNSEAWQNELWDYYDIVPEFHYACTWVGNLLSRAKLLVKENGKETRNQEALDALASLFGGSEGQAEMLRLLGVNFTVAGEGYIVGEPGKNDKDEWTVIASTEVSSYSSDEIKIENEVAKPGTLAIRLWRSHPRESRDSDPPSRAVMPTLGQIVRLTQVINAQADSRLTGAGILWVPQEIDLPPIPVASNDGDTVQQIDGPAGLNRRLVDIAKKSIDNRDSAAAQVPFVVGAPGEYLEKIQHTEFWSGFDENAQSLRDECVRRIAVGMEMPPEVLTGTGEMNHWGAWQIEEAAIKAHTEPLLDVILSSLTTGYLHPYLQDEGVENWEDFSFEADTTALRLRPNRSKEALELWDRGALSTERLLVETGFDATDVMSDDEKITWRLNRIADGSSTPEQVAAVLEMLGIPGIPGGDDEELREARPAPSLQEHPNRSTPDAGESESDDAVAQRGVTASAASGFVVDGVLMGSEQAVLRALERAGNRLKNSIGRGVGGDACDLYLSVPQMSMGECEGLLEDAWTRLDRTEWGVDRDRLRDALHSYSLMLLRMQKPMTRESLAKHLLLNLADGAV